MLIKTIGHHSPEKEEYFHGCRKGTLSGNSLWEFILVQVFLRTGEQYVSKALKRFVPFDILGIFSEGLTGYVHKNTCLFEVIIHSIYNNLET